MAKEKGKKSVPAFDFAKAWYTCPTVTAVATKVGLTYGSTLARAKSMRKMGYVLPVKSRANGTSRSQTEIDRVNAAMAALATISNETESTETETAEVPTDTVETPAE